jgi:hypothetical protein
MHLRPGFLAGLVVLSAGFAFNCGGDDEPDDPAAPRAGSAGKSGSGGAAAGSAGRAGSAGSAGKAGRGGTGNVEPECTPGVTQACLGPGACSGAQACRSDGSGWGACDCGGSDGSAGEAGSGGQAGEGQAGDSGGQAGAAGEAGAAGAGGQPGVDCDPVAQTGCEAGEKCSVVVAGETSSFECVPAGAIAPDAQCTRTNEGDDCTAGHYCVGNVGASSGMTCRPLCEAGGSPGCEVCVPYADFPSQDVGVCHPTCDPLAQDCGGLLSCLYIGETQPVCAQLSQSSLVPPGGSCRFLNQCTLGSSCLLNDPDSTEGGTLCAFHCDATGGSPSCGELDDSTEYGCTPIANLVEGTMPAAMGICVRCEDYPSFVNCPVLQPGACDEHTDCSPLEEELGREFVCNMETNTCVLDLP